MGVRTEKIYECDCCGREAKTPDFSTGYEMGSSTLSVEGSWGGKGYDGAWGGISHSETLMMCFSCAKKVLGFIESIKE